MIVAILTVVLPNAFKEVATSTLAMTALYYAVTKRKFLSKALILTWLSISIVTFMYLLVGLVNGSTAIAVNQVITIYIVSPILWIIAIRGALENFGLERIVRFLVFLTFLAMASQAFYYWAFPQDRFSTVLEIMSGTPNVHRSEEFIAAIMFVFGSMIFLYSGILASPEVIRRKIVRLILIFAILVSALTSGRSALILAMVIGSATAFIFSIASNRRMAGQIAALAIIYPATLTAGYFLVFTIYGIDISLGFENMLSKIFSGGGAERGEYVPQLLSGAAEDFFLGAGHGIGVAYIASESFPWRYEVIGAATLYRVGLPGTAVYLIPFFIALRNAIQAIRKGDLDRNEKYLFGAMVASLISANTNPYIEAVVFQWMYILPATYFIERRFLK